MHFSLLLQNFLYTRNDVQKIQKKIILIGVYECGLYSYNEHGTADTH